LKLSLAIITPGKNEAARIPLLATSIAEACIEFPFVWIYVDDSSDDNSLSILKHGTEFKPNYILNSKSSGKIIKGGAYQTWNVGIEFALKEFPDLSHLMKLDADVQLEPDYFSRLRELMENSEVGIIGGVLANSYREQNIHVPGPVKMYSKPCLEKLSELPLATGFDVMDEVLCQKYGYRVGVNREAKFRINRAIGASQGLLHGRRRNGLVCRWTGYNALYFSLHMLRSVFKKPYLIGSLSMLWGYLIAPPSPYSVELRKLHSAHQRALLSKLLRHPISGIKDLYSK